MYVCVCVCVSVCVCPAGILSDVDLGAMKKVSSMFSTLQEKLHRTSESHTSDRLMYTMSLYTPKPNPTLLVLLIMYVFYTHTHTHTHTQ